jgi:hypothetical protein
MTLIVKYFPVSFLGQLNILIQSTIMKFYLTMLIKSPVDPVIHDGDWP